MQNNLIASIHKCHRSNGLQGLEFVRIGMESQWQQEQPEPKQDERSKLAKDIFRMIQEARSFRVPEDCLHAE
jgi:hypothetical protein